MKATKTLMMATVAIVAALLVTACSKKDDDVDTTAATVTIECPFDAYNISSTGKTVAGYLTDYVKEIEGTDITSTSATVSSNKIVLTITTTRNNLLTVRNTLYNYMKSGRMDSYMNSKIDKLEGVKEFVVPFVYNTEDKDTTKYTYTSQVAFVPGVSTNSEDDNMILVADSTSNTHKAAVIYNDSVYEGTVVRTNSVATFTSKGGNLKVEMIYSNATCENFTARYSLNGKTLPSVRYTVAVHKTDYYQNMSATIFDKSNQIDATLKKEIQTGLDALELSKIYVGKELPFNDELNYLENVVNYIVTIQRQHPEIHNTDAGVTISLFVKTVAQKEITTSMDFEFKNINY